MFEGWKKKRKKEKWKDIKQHKSKWCEEVIRWKWKKNWFIRWDRLQSFHPMDLSGKRRTFVSNDCENIHPKESFRFYMFLVSSKVIKCPATRFMHCKKSGRKFMKIQNHKPVEALIVWQRQRWCAVDADEDDRSTRLEAHVPALSMCCVSVKWWIWQHSYAWMHAQYPSGRLPHIQMNYLFTQSNHFDLHSNYKWVFASALRMCYKILRSTSEKYLWKKKTKTRNCVCARHSYGSGGLDAMCFCFRVDLLYMWIVTETRKIWD